MLVLTVCMLTACGCRNSKPAETTLPTTLPTVTTEPSTESPVLTEPETTAGPTIEDGNGPISTDATTATDETGTDTARSRSGMVDENGKVQGHGSGNGITGSITG